MAGVTSIDPEDVLILASLLQQNLDWTHLDTPPVPARAGIRDYVQQLSMANSGSVTRPVFSYGQLYTWRIKKREDARVRLPPGAREEETISVTYSEILAIVRIHERLSEYDAHSSSPASSVNGALGIKSRPIWQRL